MTRARPQAMLLALWVLLAAALPAPAALASPAEAARQAAADLARAVEAMQEASRARDQVAALTRTIRAYEEGLDALRTELRDAALREATLRRRFEASSAELSQLLGVLMAIGRTQAGMDQFVHPDGPLGTARAGMLLGEIAPALAGNAARVGADLQEISALRALREDALSLLLDGLDAAQTARADLGRAIADRDAPPRRLVDDPEALAALAAAGETLDAFARDLSTRSAALHDAPGIRDFPQARGVLPMPARGVLLRRAGEADAAGVARPGLVLATAPGAIVTAPWSGTVRYAGPLRGYGNVIILEPAEGYLLVMGGLEIVYGGMGDVVDEAAPLGIMGGTDMAAPASGAITPPDGARTQSLYVELRRDGVPVDPGPWFALTATGN
ncbi:murein hydrolase activator EnvC family protein [Rhabdonatronobacter sediminivivens]|nr:peptidoglycan DD-metalloendopeptidase family protein [Rhabdonatronobacter sediminivivens]